MVPLKCLFDVKERGNDGRSLPCDLRNYKMHIHEGSQNICMSIAAVKVGLAPAGDKMSINCSSQNVQTFTQF